MFGRRGLRTNRRRIGDPLGGAAPTPPPPATPLTIITSVPVAQWVRSDLGVTIGSTLLASGVTPPVMTLTGSFSGPAPTIRIRCTVGGTLGSSVIQISYDGGATVSYFGPTASTIALTDAGAGATLNIAAGTATNGDLWVSTVAALADQSGNARNFTQATASTQPVYQYDTTLNNLATIAFDGVDDTLDSTYARPAPGTSPTLTWMVLKQATWTSTRRIIADTLANRFQVLQSGVSPNLQQNGNVGGNTAGGLLVGSWGRMESYSSATTADYLKLISTSVTGTSSGGGAGTGVRIGNSAAGTLPSNIVVAEMFITVGLPTVGERAALDAYVTARYGAGLV